MTHEGNPYYTARNGQLMVCMYVWAHRRLCEALLDQLAHLRLVVLEA